MSCAQDLEKFIGSHEDVREDDFITRDGFRRVCAVKPVTLTTGRGKKKVTRVIATRVTYASGDTVDLEHDALHPKTHQPLRVTIYRPRANL